MKRVMSRRIVTLLPFRVPKRRRSVFNNRAIMVSRSIYYQALWYCNRGNYGPTGNSRLNLKEIANRAESSELFAPVRFYYILSFCRKMIFLIEFRGVPSRIANTLNRFLFIGSARLGPGSSYILGLCMKIETPLRPLIWQGNLEGRKSKEKILEEVLKIAFKKLKRSWIRNTNYCIFIFYFVTSAYFPRECVK